ncbi:MAG: 3-deoxy-D-manno-octulosonic acid kinase [Chromatiales bacterium]|nr:3-deoxy-D-manno-octulosonic acid kinase [Chromatiales bacterium]
MPRRIARQDGNGILYEDTLLSHADPALFESASWPGAPVAPGYSGGRGATLFVECDGQRCVLRHYHRGGTIGRVLDDQFLWAGEERTRCFREWRLLARLQELGLPAPRPVAARYRRRGLIYTADLLTVLIPDVEPFSTRLARGPVIADVWAAVGRCVRAFHGADVFHADLTAHNLQIDSADRIFLLDFDQGRVRSDGGDWRQANLARLHRSLSKISEDGGVEFTPREWRWLLDGYAFAS